MRQVRLGAKGPAVSALGLGCMAMSGAYGAVPSEESTAALMRAVELGLTLFDTGDFYGAGSNEELLGEVLAPRREEIVLATKTGVRRAARGMVPDGTPDYLRRACDSSLSRLRTDRLDVYYLARLDPDVPVEDSVGAMSELVAAGKVRHIGLSEVSAATIRRAHAVHPLAAVQSEYSLWERHVENAVLPTLRELGIALVAYSPLGRGLLTGTATAQTPYGPGDFRGSTPRYNGEALQANLPIVQAVAGIADSHGGSAAQVALAWVLSRGDGVVPLAGSSRPAHVENSAAAVDLVLTEADLARIDEVVPAEGARGARYPEPAMRLIDAG
jgi:aryl-alcohol dehydrogenase-like predicted oxidoreductase